MLDTKKITFAGAMTAIGTICITLTNLLPLSFSLLTIAAFCYYLMLYKSGWVFGLLGCIACILISFAFGINGTFILNAILFAPYAILAFGIKKLTYKRTIYIGIRIIIIALFANLAFFGIARLVEFVVIFNLSDILTANSYIWLTIGFTVIAWIFDAVFYDFSIRMLLVIEKRFKI